MEYSPNKMNKFLDENIINKIVDSSDIDKDTLVIEVGPGAGSLTYKLAMNAKKVICYEIDTTLKDILSDNLKEFDNVEVKYQDFLKSNVKEDIKDEKYKKLYLVANLPYYITTPIITKVIEDEIGIEKVVIMVQKEVGDRFKANVGSKDYNSLTIYLNYYFNIKKVLDVSKNVFLPKPRIDSMVLEFDKKEELLPLKNSKQFFQLVRDSFKQKRKTLRNNLKGYDLDKIEKVLEKHNMDLSVRAEQISMEIFIDISNSLEE